MKLDPKVPKEKCATCGREISGPSGYCSFCGKKAGSAPFEAEEENQVNALVYGSPVFSFEPIGIPMSLCCASCGKEMREQDRYCWFCGAKRSDASFDPEEDNDVPPVVYGSPFPKDISRLEWYLECGGDSIDLAEGMPFGRGNREIEAVHADRAISREHLLVLHIDDESVTVEVRGLNGMVLNGKRYAMGETADLHNNDIMVLGNGVKLLVRRLMNPILDFYE